MLNKDERKKKFNSEVDPLRASVILSDVSSSQGGVDVENASHCDSHSVSADAGVCHTPVVDIGFCDCSGCF